MPILKKEPELYPDDLLNTSRERDVDHGWYAMYTLARKEKELIRQLRRKQIAHYCPLVEKRNRSPQGRVRSSWVPLFTSYVFVCGSEIDRSEAVSTGCVSKWLSVEEPDHFEEDMRRVWQVTQHGTAVQPEPKPMVGRRARIRTGVMEGTEGTISKVDENYRFTITVRFMQQGASILLDEADLELLD